MTPTEFVVGAAIVAAEPLRYCSPDPDTDRGPRAWIGLYDFAIAEAYRAAAKIGEKEKGVTPAN